jgi:hypothetical protein
MYQNFAVSTPLPLHDGWNGPEEEEIRTKLDFLVHLAETLGAGFTEHKAEYKNQPFKRLSSQP